MEKLMQVKDLTTSFMTGAGEVQAVRGVSFDIYKGESLGIVGESGSGKSVTSLSMLKLIANTGVIKSGQAIMNDVDLIQLNKKAIRDIRGNKIAMIFQDPMSSLNPLITVGKQVQEMLWAHKTNMSNKEMKDEVISLFDLVRIPEPEKRLKSYPHEFSGGMRQRVMIAMALACKPQLLIADEPTTALDVSIQDQILKLMRDIQKEMGMSILFITHDLGVIAELCSRVIVMYGGKIMEEAPIDDIFDNPMHPYTQGLIASIPKLNQDRNKQLLPIPGSPPDMLHPPSGCPFAPRCEYARRVCHEQMPPYFQIDDKHKSMCWLLHPEAPVSENPLKQGGFHD